MSYPAIMPVALGRDGWSITYDTPVKRLLFLCGLKLIGHDWHVR